MDLLSQQKSKVKRDVQAPGRTVYLASDNNWYGLSYKDAFCRYIDVEFLNPTRKEWEQKERARDTPSLWSTVTSKLSLNDVFVCLLIIEESEKRCTDIDDPEFNPNFTEALKKEAELRIIDFILVGEDADEE
jgi:hypothetical protein